MAFENGGSGHFQSDFAVTKFVTVLIFAIFCPLGIARGQSKLSKQLGMRRLPVNILYVDGTLKSCGEIGIDLRLIAKNSPYFTATDVGVPSELVGSGGSS